MELIRGPGSYSDFEFSSKIKNFSQIKNVAGIQSKGQFNPVLPFINKLL